MSQPTEDRATVSQDTNTELKHRHFYIGQEVSLLGRRKQTRGLLVQSSETWTRTDQT